jgi:hypothetical protein
MASTSSTSHDTPAAKASGSSSGFALRQQHSQQQHPAHAQGGSSGGSSVGDEKAAESRSLRAWVSAERRGVWKKSKLVTSRHGEACCMLLQG